MTKILLVCSAGMSTSILVRKIKDAAVERNIEVEVEAHSISEVNNYVNKVDVCLLGPQVRFSKDTVAATLAPIPVDAIGIQEYGLANGVAVLEQALELLNN